MQQKIQTLPQTNNTVLKHYKKIVPLKGRQTIRKIRHRDKWDSVSFFVQKMNLKRIKTKQKTGKIEQLKRKKRSKEIKRIKRIEKKGVKIKWKM